MTTIDKLLNLGIDLKNKNSGQHVFLCPECSDQRKKKREKCLSVNIDQGIYNCHHCGWNGKVFLEDEKVFAVPIINNSELNDNALKWLNDKRGISKNTAIRFNLFSEGREIGFPFIENDKIVHVKYRDASKHFRSTKNSKLTLFGMHLEHKDSIIITEGEIDAMSFYEAGHLAVSIPNGAKSFTWLDNCHKWIDEFKEIIIAYDSDPDGIAGRDELARRLGRERCKIFRFPEGIKDANELLVASKNDDNWKKIFNAYFQYIEPFPLEGVFSVNDLRERVFELRKKGYPKGEKTGFSKLDELISLPPGQLIVVTGIPSHGKSEFIDQIIIKLKLMKWLLFSPENLPYESHISKLIEKEKQKPFFMLDDYELGKLLDNLDNYFTFCDIDKIKSIEDIEGIIRQAVLSKGIKGVVIDPYSRIEHNYQGKSTETDYVRTMLDKISTLARQTGVTIILIAHPTKMQKNENGEFYVPNLYSISGSAHFYNAADIGMTIYRRPGQDFDMTEVYVQKVRFKWVGKPGMVEFKWDKETGTYREFHENNDTVIDFITGEVGQKTTF